MADERYDVIVIGGGPAGASAAYTAASRGMRVCLVDKSVFPRDKLCGGLLTLKSKRVFTRIFEADWSPVIQAVSRGAEFYFRKQLLNAVSDYKDMYFTCRRDFDNFLVTLAAKAGATLMQGTAAKELQRERCSVILENGLTLAADFIIGADGVNGVTARSIFGRPFDPETIAFGLEMEVPISGKHPSIADPEIYFGLLPWGYGWVFPKRSTLTAGIGGLWKKNQNMRTDFENFLIQRFGEMPKERIKGHYIPFGDFRPTPGTKNILLCGDAAGLVEPITGEGIAFAMQSGFYAAEAVLAARQQHKPETAINLYQQTYERIASTFRCANALRVFLFPMRMQSLFAKVLPHSASIPRRHLDLMADDISYGEYIRFLLSKFGTGAFRGIRRYLRM